MNVNKIYKKRKKRWNKLIDNRKKSSDSGELSISAVDRIKQLSDENSFEELYAELTSKDPMNFPGYGKKLETNQEKTGNNDAFIAGICEIDGIKTALGVLDGEFLMGSMGTVVGEKITRFTELAEKECLPLVIVSASGGARMQEGMFSLMQMAKTSAAIEHFKQAGGLFISILTNPTTGGVSASFASLGDILIAEPGALIGFAGPRVIQQTIGETLPDGFQSSEFLLEHGMVDLIVERKQMKAVIAELLSLHTK